MGYIHGLMAIAMRENLDNVLSMDRGFKNLQTEIYIKDYMLMENLLGLGNITGLMEAILKVYLKMVYVMGKVSGREDLEIVISMKGNMLTIRSLAMVFSLGQLVMFIKAIMKMIQEMDMAKCTGVMEVIIKANGKMEFNMVKDKFMCLDKDSKKEYFKIMF